MRCWSRYLQQPTVSAIEADGLDVLSTCVQISPHLSQQLVTAFNSPRRHRGHMVYPVPEDEVKLMR